jgi:hypothetical protein
MGFNSGFKGLIREGKTLSLKCIILRQNYDYCEITTSDWKITIIPVIALFIRQVFGKTNIAPLKIFPS